MKAYGFLILESLLCLGLLALAIPLMFQVHLQWQFQNQKQIQQSALYQLLHHLQHQTFDGLEGYTGWSQTSIPLHLSAEQFESGVTSETFLYLVHWTKVQDQNIPLQRLKISVHAPSHLTLSQRQVQYWTLITP